MKLTATITGLDALQWAHLQESVPAAGYDLREGQTRVCVVFESGTEERHTEMPLMVFTALVQRLAHRGHRVPWYDMRTPAEIEAGGPVPAAGADQGTVYGIRPHRPMSEEDRALAERVALETAPHPRVLAAVWDRSEPRETAPLDLP